MDESVDPTARRGSAKEKNIRQFPVVPTESQKAPVTLRHLKISGVDQFTPTLSAITAL